MVRLCHRPHQLYDIVPFHFSLGIKFCYCIPSIPAHASGRYVYECVSVRMWWPPTTTTTTMTGKLLCATERKLQNSSFRRKRFHLFLLVTLVGFSAATGEGLERDKKGARGLGVMVVQFWRVDISKIASTSRAAPAMGIRSMRNTATCVTGGNRIELERKTILCTVMCFKIGKFVHYPTSIQVFTLDELF